MGNLSKNIINEIAGQAVNKVFVTMATAVGFPEAALIMPLAKGLVLGLIENCYNDHAQQTLSKREMKKLNQVSEIALRTFHELAEKDSVVAWELKIDPSHCEYAYEVAEHATMEAIKQSEFAKINILGRFYGKTMYEGRTDWNDLHQIVSMIGELSYRQLVLVYLINEEFPCVNKNMFITNPHACVEIKQLLRYGIWKLSGMPFSEDNSSPIPIDYINKTQYAQVISERLMLSKLTPEELYPIINSLQLKTEGIKEDLLNGSITNDEIEEITNH